MHLANRQVSDTHHLREALHQYVRWYGPQVNWRLRSAESLGQHGRLVNLLDELVSRSRLASPMTAYRGVSPEEAARVIQDGRWSDPGFSSFSADPEVGRLNARLKASPEGRRAVIVAHLPIAMAAVNVDKTLPQPAGEREILLGRNTRFRVTGTERLGGYHMIHATPELSEQPSRLSRPRKYSEDVVGIHRALSSRPTAQGGGPQDRGAWRVLSDALTDAGKLGAADLAHLIAHAKQEHTYSVQAGSLQHHQGPAVWRTIAKTLYHDPDNTAGLKVHEDGEAEMHIGGLPVVVTRYQPWIYSDGGQQIPHGHGFFEATVLRHRQGDALGSNRIGTAVIPPEHVARLMDEADSFEGQIPYWHEVEEIRTEQNNRPREPHMPDPERFQRRYARPDDLFARILAHPGARKFGLTRQILSLMPPQAVADMAKQLGIVTEERPAAVPSVLPTPVTGASPRPAPPVSPPSLPPFYRSKTPARTHPPGSPGLPAPELTDEQLRARVADTKKSLEIRRARGERLARNGHPERYATLAGIPGEEALYPAERARIESFNKDTERTYKSLIERSMEDRPGPSVGMPRMSEIKVLGRAGEVARGGYRLGADIASHLFGHDDEARVAWAGTNSIFSANTDVPQHTGAATVTVARWMAAGKPTNRRRIEQILKKVGDIRRVNEVGETKLAYPTARMGDHFRKAADLLQGIGEIAKSHEALTGAIAKSGIGKTPNFGLAFLSALGIPIDTHMLKAVTPEGLHKTIYGRDLIRHVIGQAGLGPMSQAESREHYNSDLMKAIAEHGGVRAMSVLKQFNDGMFEKPQFFLAYKSLLAQAARDFGWEPREMQEAVWTGLLGTIALRDLGVPPEKVAQAMSHDANLAGWNPITAVFRPEVTDELIQSGVRRRDLDRVKQTFDQARAAGPAGRVFTRPQPALADVAGRVTPSFGKFKSVDRVRKAYESLTGGGNQLTSLTGRRMARDGSPRRYGPADSAGIFEKLKENPHDDAPWMVLADSFEDDKPNAAALMRQVAARGSRVGRKTREFDARHREVRLLSPHHLVSGTDDGSTSGHIHGVPFSFHHTRTHSIVRMANDEFDRQPLWGIIPRPMSHQIEKEFDEVAGPEKFARHGQPIRYRAVYPPHPALAPDHRALLNLTYAKFKLHPSRKTLQEHAGALNDAINSLGSDGSPGTMRQQQHLNRQLHRSKAFLGSLALAMKLEREGKPTRMGVADNEPLIRAAAENPWDDAPHLVLADSLEESGSPLGPLLRQYANGERQNSYFNWRDTGPHPESAFSPYDPEDNSTGLHQLGRHGPFNLYAVPSGFAGDPDAPLVLSAALPRGSFRGTGRIHYNFELSPHEVHDLAPQLGNDVGKNLEEAARHQWHGHGFESGHPRGANFRSYDDLVARPRPEKMSRRYARPLPDWVPKEEEGRESETGFVPVKSSWIAGLKLTPDERGVSMIVKRGGKTYPYPGFGLSEFRSWVKAVSPGGWWWRRIGWPMMGQPRQKNVSRPLPPDKRPKSKKVEFARSGQPTRYAGHVGHPDLHAFVRAMGENPADVQPRLVFADWLDEHEMPHTATMFRNPKANPNPTIPGHPDTHYTGQIIGSFGARPFASVERPMHWMNVTGYGRASDLRGEEERIPGINFHLHQDHPQYTSDGGRFRYHLLFDHFETDPTRAMAILREIGGLHSLMVLEDPEWMRRQHRETPEEMVRDVFGVDPHQLERFQRPGKPRRYAGPTPELHALLAGLASEKPVGRGADNTLGRMDQAPGGVMADYLEDQGMPAHARLIRSHLEQHRESEHSAGSGLTSNQVRQLLHEPGNRGDLIRFALLHPGRFIASRPHSRQVALFVAPPPPRTKGGTIPKRGYEPHLINFYMNHPTESEAREHYQELMREGAIGQTGLRAQNWPERGVGPEEERSMFRRHGHPVRMAQQQMAQSFAQALRTLASPNVQAFGDAVKSAYDEAGVQGEVVPIIHDTPENSRPSILGLLRGKPTPPQTLYAAAWHGIMSKSPAMEAFVAGDGPDSLLSIAMPGSAGYAREVLNHIGVSPRLIRPDENFNEVVVLDHGRKLKDQITQLGLPVRELTGKSVRLNGMTDYREIARSFEAQPREDANAATGSTQRPVERVSSRSSPNADGSPAAAPTAAA